jgi:hypothetical protein
MLKPSIPSYSMPVPSLYYGSSSPYPPSISPINCLFVFLGEFQCFHPLYFPRICRVSLRGPPTLFFCGVWCSTESVFSDSSLNLYVSYLSSQFNFQQSPPAPDLKGLYSFLICFSHAPCLCSMIVHCP